jgi:hypothetical protein
MYAAEASMYGSGMSKLVNASGRENHDGDAAGMLSSEGRYVDAAGLPKSDSPLGRAFIEGL